MLTFNYHKDLPTVTELKYKYLKDQVIKLKNIYQPVQKSQEWYEMRNNMLTASDWGAILEDNYPSKKNDILLKMIPKIATKSNLRPKIDINFS